MCAAAQPLVRCEPKASVKSFPVGGTECECLFHLQMSFPADSQSDEVNDDQKESPEPYLQSSDLADLRQHLSSFLPVIMILALQDGFLGLKDAGKQ